MRVLGVALMGLAAVLPVAARAAEELDEKALAARPLSWSYTLLDKQGVRFLLSYWEIEDKHYYLLRDGDGPTAPEKIVADSMKEIPATFKEETRQVLVRPETVDKDGKLSPAVYQAKTVKVVVEPSVTHYLRQGKTVLSCQFGNIVTIGERQFEIVSHKPGLGKLRDNDPAAVFNLAPLLIQPPHDELTVQDSRGWRLKLYLWKLNEKWYAVLVDGWEVKKKVLCETRTDNPAVFEDRTRSVMVKPATQDARGNPVPPVFKDMVYKVAVKSESTVMSGKDGSKIEITGSGSVVKISGVTYTVVRDAAANAPAKAVKPPKANEEDF